MKTIPLGVMVCITGLVAGCSELDSNDEHAATSELATACGDAILDAGEQCDDGNLADHDGCSAACALELVAQWSFAGAAGTEVTFAAAVADPDLTTIPVIGRGIGVAPSAATDAFSASAWTTGAVIDLDDFYSFTVAPAAGTAMNLLALHLDERRSATGIRSWSVRSASRATSRWSRCPTTRCSAPSRSRCRRRSAGWRRRSSSGSSASRPR
jgi:cysteine-rich repeat protein